MDKFPKFIIEGDNLILGKVTYHNDLVIDRKNVKGGGQFKFISDDNSFVFSGSSHEYGIAMLVDVQSCVNKGNIFDTRLDRNISKKHNFFYDSGTELIDLSPEPVGVVETSVISTYLTGLKLKIRDCRSEPNEVSWGMQEGILISKSDAKYLLTVLNEAATMITKYSSLEELERRMIQAETDAIITENIAALLKDRSATLEKQVEELTLQKNRLELSLESMLTTFSPITDHREEAEQENVHSRATKVLQSTKTAKS